MLTATIFYLRRRSARIGRYNWRILGAVWTLAVAMASAFIERMFMPKVLIEYDNCGLYIYKYRKSEPIILRYEQILGHHFEVDVGSEDISVYQMRQEQVGFISNNAVGSLVIRVDGHDIKVRGIKNVKQVRVELNKQLREFKANQKQRLSVI